MSRPVVAHQAGAVHREHHVQLLQADVMDDLVEAALEEGRVDRRHRLRALEGQPGGEQHGVLLRDAHVVVALGERLLEAVEAGAGVHRGGDPDHALVAARLLDERITEDGRVLRRRRRSRLRAEGSLLLRRGRAVHHRARLGRVPLLHPLEPALLGGDEALALDRLAVHHHRPVRLERLADSLPERLHVVPVDHAHVGEVELLEEEPGRPVGLERLLQDRPESLDPLADPGGQPRERLLRVLARVVELRVEAHAVEVARQRAHVRGDRHAVVVHHDHDRLVEPAGVQEGLEGDASGERAVPDHGHDLAVGREAAAHRLLDPDRVGHRRGRVARAHDVVLGLVDRAERGEALVLADRGELLAPAREHLVRVGLVAHVPEDLVARGVEQGVEGDRDLARAEVRAEVATDLADRLDDQLAHLLGHLCELVVVELVEVGRSVDRVEELGHAVRVRM